MKSNEKSFFVEDTTNLVLIILAKGLLIIAKGLLIIVLVILLASFFLNNPNRAQCESIGGRYDGDVCWYNGSKIDVDKYVEEWK